MNTRPRNRSLRTSSFLWLLLLTLFATACRSDSLGPTLNLDTILEGELEIAPGELVLNDGESGFLSLRLILSDGTVKNLPNNSNVTWNSSAPGIASVSSSGTVVGKLPGVAEITASTSQGTASLAVIVLPTPSELRPLFDGDIYGTVGASLPDSVAVRVVDRGGLPVAGVEVSFHVEMGGGSVSPRTAITASDGSAKVQWRLGNQAGDNALRATANGLADAWLHARGEANGDEDQLELVGGNHQRGTVNEVLGRELSVRVVDQYGNPVQDAPVTWIFDDGSTATAGGGGASAGSANAVGAAADAQGVSRIRWRLSKRAGRNRARAKIGSAAEVWFEAEADPSEPKSIAFSPRTSTIGVGARVTYSATVVDEHGNEIPNAQMQWVSRNPSVATVSQSGVATGIAPGEAEIVATSGDILGGGDLAVQSVGPSRIRIVSGNGQSGPVGATLPTPMSVKVTDASGNGLSGIAVAWNVTRGGGSVSSSSTSTDGSGVARANLTLGPSAELNQVTATAGGLSPVTFSATAQAGSVASVSVTPSNVSMVVGDTRQLFASALDASGNGVSGVSFQWSSSNSGIVSVDNAGRITGTGEGTATVTASSGGHSGSATVTSRRTVGGISLSISQVTLNAIGDTAHVTARATDGSGAQVNNASITWTSETPNIVGVDAIGRIYTKGVGVGRAKASVGDQSATVTIDARQIMAAVSVSPGNPSVTIGGQLQLVANAVDSNGVAMLASQDSRMFWESTDAGIATVSASGVATGVATGNATIKLVWEEDDTNNSRSLRTQTTLSVTESSSPPPPPPPDNPPPPPPPPSNGGPTPDLPRASVDTRYTAPSGNVIRVPSGGDLQGALNSAQQGDHILLEAGGVYRGNFTLPVKSGSSWITISTETNLPGQGTRMTPNIASSARLARIESAQGFMPAIAAAPGAHHYRLMGLEVTTASGVNDQGEIISIGGGTSQHPQYIILDRMYVHGNSGVATKRCVGLNAVHGAVVDSYLDRCHKFGQDSQAILIWDGPGPYKIENNYLAAAGENIMVGGADPTTSGLVPSDITIRRNFFHKPDGWYTNPVGTVKNLFELKNARRVLLEGNILEGNWTDGQTGWGVIIKSTNQNGACTWCVSEHVTMRYNIMRKMGNGITVMRGNSAGTPAGSTNNVLIEHNILDALGPSSGFSGDPSWGSGFLILQGPQALTIRHNTVIAERHIIYFTEGAASGMIFNDNIATHGQYGIFSSSGQGSAAVSSHMPGGEFLGNVISGVNASQYPANNYYPSSVGGIGFSGSTNYLLSSSSQYKGLATDGSDPGANIGQVSSLTSGVR